MLRAPEMRWLKATRVIFNWEKSSGISIQIEEGKTEASKFIFSWWKARIHTYIYVHIYTRSGRPSSQWRKASVFKPEITEIF